MRKSLRSALGVLAGTVLVSVTMAAPAAPASASAGECAGATPLGVTAQAGTLDAATPQLWWTHSVDADDRVVTLATPGGSATLEVRGVDCTTVLCVDSSSSLESATCELDQGREVVVGVVGDPAGAAAPVNQVMAFVVDEITVVPGECNDGVDNDRDGATDFGSDAECTSTFDRTESPLHVAAYGHITIMTNASDTPTMELHGVFKDPKKFTCRLQPSPVQVTCVQVHDTEWLYQCTHFVVTAEAWSTSKPEGRGSTQGSVECDSGNDVTTDVVSSWTDLKKTFDEADSFHPYVRLGTAGVVVCRALDVNGASPNGAYSVKCAEPGVAWPVESVQNPLG